jgi:hypothetical protein
MTSYDYVPISRVTGQRRTVELVVDFVASKGVRNGTDLALETGEN